MAQNGFWYVNIGDDIELPQCDVNFDDQGKLDITTGPETDSELIKKVKVLPDDDSQAFEIKIEKATKLQATFHQCTLISAQKADTRSRHIFRFRYTLA